MQGYDAMRVAFKAMEALNGKVDDPKAFVEAVRKVKMSEAESPRGPFYFDSFGNPNQNIYIKPIQTMLIFIGIIPGFCFIQADWQSQKSLPKIC